MFLGMSPYSVCSGINCGGWTGMPGHTLYGVPIPTSVVDRHPFHTVRLSCRFPVMSKQVVLCTL